MKKATIFGFIRIVCFAVVVLLVNSVLNYAYNPSTQFHRLQNHELYSNPYSYEIIGFGPSDCKANFDPEIVQEKLGMTCFNYGQLGTTYKLGGVEASFINAMSVQKPKIAVFFVSHENLYSETDNEEASKTFILATPGMTNKYAKAMYYYRSSKKDGALEKIFIWKEDMQSHPLTETSYVKNNIRDKGSEGYRNSEIDWFNSNNKGEDIYLGNGYCPYTYEEPQAEDNEDEEEDIYKIDLTGYNATEALERQVIDGKDLDKMIKKCKKQGIETYIVMGTLEQTEIFKEGTLYDIRSNVLKQIAKNNDTPYFDMNYVRKEFCRANTDEWYDRKHLNYVGAKRFTEMLCKLIQAVQNGEDTSKYFYSDFKEYLESFENVEVIGE